MLGITIDWYAPKLHLHDKHLCGPSNTKVHQHFPVTADKNIDEQTQPPHHAFFHALCENTALIQIQL
jgi:hypothetical protein